MPSKLQEVVAVVRRLRIWGAIRRTATPGIVAVAVTAGVGGTAAATTAADGGSAPDSSARSPLSGPVADLAIAGSGTLEWTARFRAPVPAVHRGDRPATRRRSRASRSEARRPLDPRTVARVLLAKRGWGGQFGCLDALWTRESNWRVNAANPTSSAYGIPQALPGSKMASAGADWRTNPVTQIRWGLSYIAGSYGSPCAAWAHSRSYGYY